MIILSNVKSLVFEGGGIKGMAYIGFLRTIEEFVPGFLNKIEQFAGSSVGAFVAALLTIGKTPNDIEHIMRSLASSDLLNTGCGFMPKISVLLRALFNMTRKYGMIRTKSIEKELRNLFTDENGKDILFADLKKRLIVTSANLNTHKIVFFSNELTPKVPVYKAVMASMCIPFVFEPVKYDFNPDYNEKKHYLIDGGNLMNFPIKVFDDEDPYESINSSLSNKTVLGLRLDTPEDLNYEKGTTNEKIDSFVSYVNEFIDTMYYNSKLNIRDDERTVSIIVKSSGINVKNYNDIFDELLKNGNDAADEKKKSKKRCV